MNPDPGRFIEVNGISLYVEERGAGVPVLLLHGFPDSARLWRNQVPFLVSNGFRVITPDLRGFGRSGRPQEVAPDRVRRMVVISVPHPLAPVTLRQHEMAWYQLFFQFAGVAEATVRADDWAWLRMFSRGDGDTGQWIQDLSRPGALTAALNWARANLAPRMPGPPPSLPPVQAPVLGIWSDGDHFLDGERMRQSAAWVAGPWRYAEIAGASHWVPRDAPGQLNDLLLDWLR